MATPTKDAPDRRSADRLLARTTRHGAVPVAVLALVGTASTAAGLALPAALGLAVDALLAGESAAGRVGVCAALTCALVLLDAVDGLLTGTTTARGTAWLRRRLLGHVLAAGPRAAARFTPGDLITRLVGNAAHAGAAPTAVAALPSAVAAPVGGLVALALIDPWLAVVFLAGTPLLAALLRGFARQSSDSVARYQRAQGDIAGRLVEALGGARTVAAAGTEARERDRVLAPLPELTRQGHRMWRVQGRATAQAAALVPLLQIAVLAVGGVRLAEGHLTAGGLLAASRYAVYATGIGVLVGYVNALVRARTAARRLTGVTGLPAPAEGTRALPPDGPGTLRLSGVTVSRDGTPVLDGLDLTVPGGTCLAVVGRSGAGKSLLAAVAGHLAEPDAGRVLLDGVPLDELSREELRREVGYAFERPVLIGETVGDAVAFGAFTPAPARVADAARAACADGFVALLPDGWATRRADAPMSGGEVQRLGLARAFAHAGRLLVLDDATSSLDTVTELKVGEALVRDVRARTRLIVAHRASTAARADAVAWLDGGRVVAVDRHERLWRRPEYRAVFTAEDEPDGDEPDGAGPGGDEARAAGPPGEGPRGERPGGAEAGDG
ncbi:ABC transporter ATP-binding protein [Streptomyces capparidis]